MEFCSILSADFVFWIKNQKNPGQIEVRLFERNNAAADSVIRKRNMNDFSLRPAPMGVTISGFIPCENTSRLN